MADSLSNIKLGNRVVRTEAPLPKDAATKEIKPGTRLEFLGFDPISVHLGFINASDVVKVNRTCWDSRWFTPERG